MVGIFIRISTKLRCLTQIKDGQIALASPFLSFNHRTCTHRKVSISATSRKLIEIQFSIIIIVVVNVIFDRIKQGRNPVWNIDSTIQNTKLVSKKYIYNGNQFHFLRHPKASRTPDLYWNTTNPMWVGEISFRCLSSEQVSPFWNDLAKPGQFIQEISTGY